MGILTAHSLPAALQTEADWFLHNIPFFACPDPSFQEIYYFRWEVFRKHLRPTPAGFVVTEFLPAVPWAGTYNTISCSAGHHLYEGRWLRASKYLDEYATFWLRNSEAAPRLYSFWIADALYARALVTGDTTLPLSLLADLVHNYTCWEAERLDACGLFWQLDDRDGMEFQIGGSGCRLTLNSYQYGDALAIANLARLAGWSDVAQIYTEKAERLKFLVQERLWDSGAQFFKTLPTEVSMHYHMRKYQGREMGPSHAIGKLVDVRELQGYVPWYFNLPASGYEAAWLQLRDPEGFAAPYGPSTAERRHPAWQPAPAEHQHECLWRGSSWPFATSQTLTALANLLHTYEQQVISTQDYFSLLQGYVQTHYLTQPDGSRLPWIDESAHPDTGEWVTRAALYRQNREDKERGRDYNHSTFADLIITGLVGLRPRADDLIEVNPLVPQGTWNYFCLDAVPYHHQLLTIIYDKEGIQYGQGPGLHVYANGMQLGTRPDLGRLTASLHA